jgi:GNAT superfamily N-acetyltransferase
MATIDRFNAEDRDQIDALYRRVFGADAAEASRLRWEWQYRRNPHRPPRGPQIWIAREGPTIIGQYATMPVRLSIKGQDVDASWGMDVMVAPERQRQGLGELLFGTWDRHVGASLGLGLSSSSHRLFQKLRWPDVGPLPCLIKPLSRRALRRAEWSQPLNRLVSAVTYPAIRLIARDQPLPAPVEPIRRFSGAFTDLWTKVAPRFDLAVRRDADYLQWKYIGPPHVRYSVVAVFREGEPSGYAVYRHVQEPRGRVTLLVDLLTEPSDHVSLRALLRWVDREARANDSDKIRCFCMHAGFRRALKRAGYFQVKSSVQFVVKVNALPVDHAFYERTDRWHVTLGDSDQDR